MIRRTLPALICVAALLVPIPVTVSADERPTPRPRAIALELPPAGMAVVPIDFRISTTPGPGAEKLTAALQLRSARDGFVTVRKAKLDRRGSVTGSVVSRRPGAKEYRAILLSASGRIVAVTAPRSVTWARLEHAVALDCAQQSAPVDVDVPCTIQVSPAVRLDDMVVTLQFKVSMTWLSLESFRVPAQGRVSTDVRGRVASTVEYRVLLMRDAEILAESAALAITYG